MSAANTTLDTSLFRLVVLSQIRTVCGFTRRLK